LRLPLAVLSTSIRNGYNSHSICLRGVRLMSEKEKGSTQTLTPAESSATPRHPSEAERHWERNTLEPALKKSPERQKEFTTISSVFRSQRRSASEGWRGVAEDSA